MRTLITLALVAAATLPAFADGNTASATAATKAFIVAPLKIENYQSSVLNFGSIVVSDTTAEAKATMTTVTAPNGGTTPTLTYTKNCAAYKRVGTISAAQFHYSFDIQAAKKA